MHQNYLTVLSNAIHLSESDKLDLIIELLKNIRQDLRIRLILEIYDSVDSESLKIAKSLHDTAKKLAKIGHKLGLENEALELLQLVNESQNKLSEASNNYLN